MKKKKSALEEAFSFVGNKVNNFSRGVQKTFVPVTKNIQTTSNSLANDYNNFKKTQNIFNNQNKAKFNNFVKDYTNTFVKNPTDQWAPVKFISNKTGLTSAVKGSPAYRELVKSDTYQTLKAGLPRAKGGVKAGLGVMGVKAEDIINNYDPFAQSIIPGMPVLPGITPKFLTTSPNGGKFTTGKIKLKINDELKKRGLPTYPSFREVAKPLFESAQKDVNLSNKMTSQLKPLEDRGNVLANMQNPEWWKRNLLLNAPSFVSSLGIGALTAFVTKNPQIAAGATFTTAFPQNAGEMYFQAKDGGASEEEAYDLAAQYGLLSSALDTLGVFKILNKATGGVPIKGPFMKEVLSGFARSSLSEGSTESAQQIIQNALAKFNFDPNRPLTAGALESFAIGGLMGGSADVAVTAGGAASGRGGSTPEVQVAGGMSFGPDDYVTDKGTQFSLLPGARILPDGQHYEYKGQIYRIPVPEGEVIASAAPNILGASQLANQEQYRVASQTTSQPEFVPVAGDSNKLIRKEQVNNPPLIKSDNFDLVMDPNNERRLLRQDQADTQPAQEQLDQEQYRLQNQQAIENAQESAPEMKELGFTDVKGVEDPIVQGQFNTADVDPNITKAKAQEIIGGMFTPEEAKIMFDENQITTPDGKLADGKYFNSLISVVEHDGKVDNKTVYHEAFHAFTDKFVTPDVYAQAIAEAKLKYDIKSDQMASEQLAEDFADFAAGRQTFTGKIAGFFQDLLTKITGLISKKNTAQELFQQALSGSRPSVAGQVYINSIKNGGTTINLAGKVPTQGYALSLTKGAETIVDPKDINTQTVQDFISNNAEALSDVDNYIGAWYNEEDGKLYLDISTVKSDLQEAKRLGLQANQIAIWDLGNSQEIRLSNEQNTTQSENNVPAGNDTGNQSLDSNGQPEAFRTIEGSPTSGGPGGEFTSEATKGLDTPRITPNNPIPELIQGSQVYNQARGLEPVREGIYVPVDINKARTIAEAYDALPVDDSQNPEVQQAYQALANEVKNQWDYATSELGIFFEPWTSEGQPYQTSAEMADDVANNKHLYFFQGGEPHPFLSAVDPETGFSINDQFRAIHDLYGHAAEGFGFGPRGEENAWIKHSQMFTPEAQRALTTETRGQNSWVNFGPQNFDANGNPLNIPPSERPYAPQKVALLPEEFSDWRSEVEPQYRRVNGKVEQPEGLKTPIGQISTAELQARIQTKTKFKDAYEAELSRRGVFPPKEGVKERQTIDSIRTNESNRDAVREGVTGTYDMTSDEGRLQFGRDYVKNNYEAAEKRVLSQEPMSNDLASIYYAIQEDLQQRADAADKAGNIEEARALDDKTIAIDNKMAEKLTPVAQILQFAHMFSQKSPEAMVRWAKRIYEESNQLYNLSPIRLAQRVSGKGWQKEFTPEMEQYVKDEVIRIRKIKDETTRATETQKLMQEVVKDIPPSVMQYSSAYRYQNMLINPLTQLRNIYFNTVNTVALRPSTVLLTGANDTIARNLFRTKGNKGKVTDVGRYYKGMLGGLDNASKSFLEGLSGAESSFIDKASDTVQFSSYKAATNKNLPLGLQIASRGMEAADRMFTELIANGEYQINKSKGMKDADAKKEAYETAAKFLYRKQLDPTNQTGQGLVLSKMDGLTDWIIKGRNHFGPIGWFVPFVRVPMAVAKMSMEYNPIFGPATLVQNSHKSEQFAKMEIGAAFMFAGAMMAAAGDTTWDAPIDPKAKQLFYDSGRKPFSVRVDNNPILKFLTKVPGASTDKEGRVWVPMTYLGPLGLNFALPAAYKWYFDQDRGAQSDDTAEKLFKVATSALNYWASSTPLTGLGGFVRTASGDVDYSFASNLGFTAGQGIPFNGALVYIANLLDPIYRKTDNSTAASAFKTQIQKGIPILSKKLEPYTDLQGNPSMRNRSNYILPYSLGIENPDMNQPYEDRLLKLQSNAVKNKKVKEFEKNSEAQEKAGGQVAGASETIGQSELIDGVLHYRAKENGEMKTKTMDLNKVLNPASGMDKYKQPGEIAKKAREIHDLPIAEEEKLALYDKLGTNAEEVRYDYLAHLDAKVKTAYLVDKFTQNPDYDFIIERLTTGRVESVTGDLFVTDSVLKNLYDDGIISASDYKALKALKYDKNGNQIKSKSSGGSKKVAAFDDYPKIKTRHIDLGGNAVSGLKVSPLKGKRLKISNINAPESSMPKLTPPSRGKVSLTIPRFSSSIRSLGKV